MQRARFVSRTAYSCLVFLVLGSLCFALSSAFVIKDATQILARATERSDLFVEARHELGGEQSVHNRYELERSARARQLHDYYAQRLVADLHAIRTLTHPTMIAIADRLLTAHTRYITATHELFRASDKHDIMRVRFLDDRRVDPQFDALLDDFNAQITRLTSLAATANERLRETENQVIALTMVASIVAIIVLGSILMILRHYERLAAAAICNEMDQLKRAALTDHLTGLGNYHAYQRTVDELALDGTTLGVPVTVALVNVDEFKALNDRRGHVAGDRVLASLATILAAGNTSRTYRLGGDEFALTFVGLTVSLAHVRLEGLRCAIETQLGGTTVSIGLATSSDADRDLTVLRDQADNALCEAKRRGRNTVVSFDEIRDEVAMFSPARIAEVRDLIAGGTMGVAFQPIWDLKNGRILGYEALARPGPEHPINPQDAFDIAERIGKAHDLDRLCRTAVLAEARTLPPDVLLFINVSPQSLDHAEFAGNALVEAVEAAGLSPQHVVLEITERSIARLPVVIREAKRLRDLGFALALDDAGSGNSGLEMLSQLAVDFVKIDREVIVRAQFDVGGRAVLAGIVAIAQEMHAEIIAEGIEDRAMLDIVRNATRWSRVACAVQGYYLGRPSRDFVTATEFALAANRLAPYAGFENQTARTA